MEAAEALCPGGRWLGCAVELTVALFATRRRGSKRCGRGFVSFLLPPPQPPYILRRGQRRPAALRAPCAVRGVLFLSGGGAASVSMRGFPGGCGQCGAMLPARCRHARLRRDGDGRSGSRRRRVAESAPAAKAEVEKPNYCTNSNHKPQPCPCSASGLKAGPGLRG